MDSSVSIIMTVYNQERYLAEAIESLLAQTREDFELLVWDDGSKDSSVEIARNYAQQDQRVRVVAAPHLGRSAALNAATAETHGHYIGFVDSDDRLAPTALQETVELLNRFTEIGVIYTDYLVIDEHGTTVRYGTRCRHPYSRELLLLHFMTFHFRLMRRCVFDQVGGIEESFKHAEDWDLCLRLSEVTEFKHINQPLYYHRTHPGNNTYRRQMELIHDCRRAVTRALERRGLSQRFEMVEKISTQIDSDSGRPIVMRTFWFQEKSGNGRAVPAEMLRSPNLQQQSLNADSFRELPKEIPY